MTKENYIKLPKPGTNPRGVEITKEALLGLIRDEGTQSIPIELAKDRNKFQSL
jgi:hypothetical protein